VPARSSRLSAEDPFRVLELPPTANDLQVWRRATELRLIAEVDRAGSGVVALICLAEDVLEEPVRRFTSELVDPFVAGDHSFHEPATLFSGKFTANGTNYSKRVLVPALDQSERLS
jgi:hypothetical protein